MSTLTPVDMLPVLAVFLGQLPEAPAGLAIYGPIGTICLWLIVRDERRSKDSELTREAINKVAHEMRGFNLNWLMHNATHSPSAGIRELATKELERKQSSESQAR